MDGDRRLIRRTGPWDEMRAAFRWQVPPRFNIACACAEVRATTDPDRTALIHVSDDGVERWSAVRLDDAAARFASVLASAGIARGDRVAILLSQGPETLIAHLGAMRLGAVSLPLFTLFS
jgi:acetyl-CoA synthetase